MGNKRNTPCFSKPTGTCCPITCKEPLFMNEFCWSPVVMDPTVKVGTDAIDCHSPDRFLKSKHPSLSEYNSTKAYPEGTEVICECYDDYVARLKKDYLKLTFNIALEKACADGPKKQSDELYANGNTFGISRQFDGYQVPNLATSLNYQHSQTLNRKKLTSDLFNQKGAGKMPVAWNNDKLVAKCVDGQWKIPSHECVCQDKVKAMKKACADMVDSNFNGICKAGGGMLAGSSAAVAPAAGGAAVATPAPTIEVEQEIKKLKTDLKEQGLTETQINKLVSESLVSSVQQTNDRLQKLDQKNIDLVNLIKALESRVAGGTGVIAGSTASSSAFAVKLGYGLVPIAFVQAVHGL